MGTRWLGHIHTGDKSSPILTTIYGQFDGYPDGAGSEIKRVLGDKALVNGISGDRDKCVNGMGCAAATLVKGLKDEAGNIYIFAAGSKDVWEEYVYDIYDGGGVLHMDIDGGKIYSGPISAFDPEQLVEDEE